MGHLFRLHVSRMILFCNTRRPTQYEAFIFDTAEGRDVIAIANAARADDVHTNAAIYSQCTRARHSLSAQKDSNVLATIYFWRLMEPREK